MKAIRWDKLAIGYWLLAIGYWLLAIGYWLLAIGYWLCVTVHDVIAEICVGYALSVEKTMWRTTCALARIHPRERFGEMSIPISRSMRAGCVHNFGLDAKAVKLLFQTLSVCKEGILGATGYPNGRSLFA